MASTILDGNDTIRRERREQLRELAADLTATAVTEENRIASLAIQTRPTLLRRVAGLIAEHVIPGVDRIFALASDTPLATAVSLHTGIPFATVDFETEADNANVEILGELYAGENVAIIATTAFEITDRVHECLAGLGIGLVSTTVAIAVEKGAGDQLTNGGLHDQYIYQLTADGLRPCKER